MQFELMTDEQMELARRAVEALEQLVDVFTYGMMAVLAYLCLQLFLLIWKRSCSLPKEEIDQITLADVPEPKWICDSCNVGLKPGEGAEAYTFRHGNIERTVCYCKKCAALEF